MLRIEAVDELVVEFLLIVLLSVCDVDSVLRVIVVADSVYVPVDELSIHEILGRNSVFRIRAEERLDTRHHLQRVSSLDQIHLGASLYDVFPEEFKGGCVEGGLPRANSI